MKVILDTNVLVAGLLTPFGMCGEIVRMLSSGEITLCVDARILFEYQDVLRRPHFHIAPSKLDVVLAYIGDTAQAFPTTPLPKSLPDRDDEPFLEVALAAKADCIVTGNVKHFPANCRTGIQVLSPHAFLDLFKKRRTTASRRRPKGRA